MNLRSLIASGLILITLVMSHYIRVITRLYRVFVVIDEETSQVTKDTLNLIMRYQNIVWVLIIVLIVGLASIIAVQNGKSVKSYFKNMY